MGIIIFSQKQFKSNITIFIFSISFDEDKNPVSSYQQTFEVLKTWKVFFVVNII